MFIRHIKAEKSPGSHRVASPIIIRSPSRHHEKKADVKHKKHREPSPPKHHLKSESPEEVHIHERKHKERKHKKSEKKSRHSPGGTKKKKKKSKHASKSSSLEKSISISREMSASPQVQIRRGSPEELYHDDTYEHRNLYPDECWPDTDSFTPRGRSMSPKRKNNLGIVSPSLVGNIVNERKLKRPTPSVQRVSSPHTPPLPPKAYENSKLDRRRTPSPSSKRPTSPDPHRRYDFSLTYYN